MDEGYGQRVTLQQFGKHLVATLQGALTDAVLARFRNDLLERIHLEGAAGVIVDLSGVDVLDVHEFTSLRRVLDMSRLMGARPLLAGLNPGVAAALIQMDADTSGLETAMTVEAALERLAAEEAVLEQPTDEDQLTAPDEIEQSRNELSDESRAED